MIVNGEPHRSLGEGYHVIVNPHSGAIRNGHLAPEKMIEVLGDGTRITLTRDLDHLRELVRSLRGDRVGTVAILGGDGSILNVLTSFVRAYDGGNDLPDFHLLGGGTVNALLGEFKATSKPIARLERFKKILDGQIEKTYQERNVLDANGINGFIFGAGYLRNASEYYDSHNVNGIWTSMLVTLKITKGLILEEPAIVKFLADLPADIQFDGHPIGLKTFNFTYLSTITSNGLNLKVTPSACAEPNRFEAVVTHVTVGELLSAFFKMSFGATLKTPKLERAMVTSVRFDAPDPIAWFMDGDRFEPARTIVVKLGPKLRFLQ